MNAIDFAGDGLAKKLIATREAAGLTLAEAARKAGIFRENLSLYESGKKVPTDTVLFKLAMVYSENTTVATKPSGELTAFFHEWCLANAHRVETCFFLKGEPIPKAFLISTSEKYSFDLGREIAALESQLVLKGIRVSIMQIPRGAGLSAIFEVERAEVVYPK